jgi:hypothetical protein
MKADGATVLIFPAGMPDACAFRDRARARGLRVIGASSVPNDPARGEYEFWEELPYVSDPAFDDALVDVMGRHGVSAIHAPHFVVWSHLDERLPEIAPAVQLSGEDRPQDHERAYRALQSRMAAAAPVRFEPAFPPQPPLSLLERTGLMRLMTTIPGMCAEEKALAVMEVMRHAPKGDVVEIGSWWGRSAALFVWLAGRYDVGQVLCVDPWIGAAMPQGDALLDRTSAELDTEQALRMFEINLAPLAAGRMNYLRARAEDAAHLYRPGLAVQTDAFGETRYEGVISVLHIDGNHAERHAALDTALWTPFVRPGGWIIFDDYEWAFGDGPRKVADAFIQANRARVAALFQAGPALFLQFRSETHG